MFGPFGIPETFTDQQVRDALRGAADGAKRVRDSAPCDEHKTAIDQAADLLRGVADEIDQVRGTKFSEEDLDAMEVIGGYPWA